MSLLVKCEVKWLKMLPRRKQLAEAMFGRKRRELLARDLPVNAAKNSLFFLNLQYTSPRTCQKRVHNRESLSGRTVGQKIARHCTTAQTREVTWYARVRPMQAQ